MKKKSLKSRALIGFVPSSIGILLTLFVFAAFPSSSALAIPQCEEVYFEQTELYGYIYLNMVTDTSGATIFFKVGSWVPPGNPTHNGSTPSGSTLIWSGGPKLVFSGQCFKALCYKAGCSDSIVTEYCVEYP